MDTDPQFFISSILGRRETNEDRYTLLQRGRDWCAMVCDGHGGSEAAEMTVGRVGGWLERVPWPLSQENISHLTGLLHRITTSPEIGQSGSTLLFCLFVGGIIQTVNLGDCRAVATVQSCSLALSYDHKPDHPLERVWSQRVGGERGVYWDGCWRIGEGVATSRGVGDRDCHPYLRYTPTVTEFSNRGCSLVLLASDGLWDVIETDRALRFLQDCQHGDWETYWGGEWVTDEVRAGTPSQRLCQLAYALGSEDNITVVVAYL